MPSRAISLGDHVRVPWGLDTLEGVVEDIYETGSGPRVVVRVAVPGSSEDGETVTLPADTVELRDEADGAPPGAWVTAAQYERKVSEALQRVLPSLEVDGEVQLGTHAKRDRGSDFVVRSGHRNVLIQVKTGTRQRHITTDMVNQLRRQIAYAQQKDVAGLLVTDLTLTPAAHRLLRASPRLRAVRWHGPRDDGRLAAALASLLAGNEE
jgi:hypothetical protein